LGAGGSAGTGSALASEGLGVTPIARTPSLVDLHGRLGLAEGVLAPMLGMEAGNCLGEGVSPAADRHQQRSPLAEVPHRGRPLEDDLLGSHPLAARCSAASFSITR
jgi:hypothetical protein